MQAIYTMTLRELVENLPANSGSIFGEYPIFDENHRADLEQGILNHYWFREIGVETPGRFIFNLKQKMLEIMPYWNKVYMSDGLEQRILDNYDVTEAITRTTGGTVKHSDTPQGQSTLVGSNYLTDLTEDTNTETISTHRTGNIGVQYDAQAIEAYRGSLLKIDLLIMEELSDLFMKIY